MVNTSIESGVHSIEAEVESLLTFDANFVMPGTVSFHYTLNTRGGGEGGRG